MENKSRSIRVDEEIKVLKLKVKSNHMLYNGQILLIYESVNSNNDEPKQKKLKSTEVGIVKNILVKEGDILTPGSVVVELEKKCDHPTVIKDLCAVCGADLIKENSEEGNQVSHASVSMVHMVPELKVNDKLAQILGKADMDRLLEHKKLVLLVDLDQTLIHTTNDNIPNNIKDVYHFQLYGPRSPWYHTRLRPGTHNFLQGISERYELHICTFGSRRYAHTIAKFLDPVGKFFSHRILSRDECFDPNSKTANLRALFPCGENMVCIIDDREDVWDYASNLIHVKPYHFFQHTGDIHAPPGLTKCENDDYKEGYDFSKINESNATSKSEDKENEEASIDGSEPIKYEDLELNEANPKEEFEISKSESEKKSEEETNGTTALEVSKKSVKEISKKQNVENSNSPVKVDELSENDNKLPDESVIEIETISNTEDKPTQETQEIPEINSNRPHVSNFVSKPIYTEDGFIKIEETDDYLLYLEEILKTIHDEFFRRYEKSKIIPDLKKIVPETRAKVLQGVNIVFSGIVPNRQKLEDSQAYKIACSLGAKVSQNIEPNTTHLVALRAGTAKVHAAYKRKNLKLVTPEWLWTCAERWEKVDERMFPLKNAKLNVDARHPPAHCRSPEQPEPLPMPYEITNKVNSSQVGGFLYSINPFMSLSSEDIESMEGEVEDMFKESDGENDDTFQEDDEKEPDSKKRKLSSSSSTSSSNTENDDKYKKFTKKRKKCDAVNSVVDETNEEEDSDDETINTKFRRGESLPSDLDIDYNTEEGTEEDQESDGEWNVMGAALEREFLEGE